MGDVLQKILAPVFQTQYPAASSKVEEVISEEVFEKTDNGNSALSSTSSSSRPTTPRSGGKFIILF